MALQVGAFTAPLLHAHPDDDHGDHHSASAVHAHFGGHPHGPANAGHHDYQREDSDVASGLRRTADYPVVALRDEPERTTRVQIFVAVEASAFTIPALPRARFILAPAPESMMRRRPDVVRSHGPPAARAASPRAPPAPSV